MNKLIEFLRHEIPEVAAVTGYFLVCFGIIGLLMKLYLLEHGIHVESIAKAAIAALIVGKVVVVLEKTKIGERFAQHAVWITVLYRAFVYTLFVAAVMTAEKIFHVYRELGVLRGAVAHALDEVHVSRSAATSIGVFLSFVGFGVYAELERSVGRARMLRFLFDREGRRPASETTSAA